MAEARKTFGRGPKCRLTQRELGNSLPVTVLQADEMSKVAGRNTCRLRQRKETLVREIWGKYKGAGA